MFCQQDYFGECAESVIKDHVVTVYELLEEMLDNGFPLATESNVLKEMIRPPTILRSVVNTLTGKLTLAALIILSECKSRCEVSKVVFIFSAWFL